MEWRNPLHLRDGMKVCIVSHGLEGYVELAGDCFYVVLDATGKPIWHGYSPNIEVLDARDWKGLAINEAPAVAMKRHRDHFTMWADGHRA